MSKRDFCLGLIREMLRTGAMSIGELKAVASAYDGIEAVKFAPFKVPENVIEAGAEEVRHACGDHSYLDADDYAKDAFEAMLAAGFEDQNAL